MPGSTPSRRTGALAAGLALCSVALAAAAPAGPLLTGWLPVSSLELAAVLAVVFCLAELCLLHVEVQREAYSVTLAGIPLAVGVLLCDSRELAAARVLGSAAAFGVQRIGGLKAGYNLAAYAFEATAGLAVMHRLVPTGTDLTVAMAIGCGLVLLVVDQLMSLLVTRIISWHQGGLTGRQRLEVHLPALICNALATSGAYGLVLLSTHGPVGLVVIVVFLAGAALAYRAFQVLHRRHQALAHVHAFVALNDGDTNVPDLAGQMLEQIRALMRAGSAELLVPDRDSPLHLTVDEDGTPRPVGHRRRAGEHDATALAPPPAAALLTRTTRDSRARAWLTARGVKDAVIVALPGPGGTDLGTLMVLDRLGDTGSFNPDDRTLLQTLAGHLAVAISSGRRRDQLRYDATHDVLTGLANRALLNTTLDHALAEPHPRRLSVLLLDLDKFKEVNDTLGHHVGDALLKVIAERLVVALPPGSTIARLGGDEFAALIPDPPGTGPGPAALARQVGDALARPIALPEATLSVRASIGMAPAGPRSTASDLLRHADTAMYAAKADHNGGVVVYTSDLDRGRAERLALLADLHLALERDELRVLYQPKLDLATDRITSVEALVRWQHPHLGALGPDLFVPLAEANGLIGSLTKVVLTQALGQCAAWRAEGLDIAVAVNLSARTVNDPGLPEAISTALLHAGVPASRLILEVTESAVMDDPDRAVVILERIAAIGVRLSLDDFGTGYSSLAYLQRLPVQEVKIDKSFINGLTADHARSQVLVRSIINLGRSLGLRVVAEGVEDADTLELLRELGCDLIQGYHVSPPQPPDNLAPLLRRTPARPRLRTVTA